MEKSMDLKSKTHRYFYFLYVCYEVFDNDNDEHKDSYHGVIDVNKTNFDDSLKIRDNI